MHRVYLSLGSNIQPEIHLPRAIELLHDYGEIRRVSSAWESEAVGSDGPNFLNACVLLLTPLSQAELKANIIDPVETKLGRKRSNDKNAPRTIDIDAILFDDRSLNDKFWKQAFVVVPLAEIYPEYPNPLTQEPITNTAEEFRREIWLEVRSHVLANLTGAA